MNDYSLWHSVQVPLPPEAISWCSLSAFSGPTSAFHICLMPISRPQHLPAEWEDVSVCLSPSLGDVSLFCFSPGFWSTARLENFGLTKWAFWVTYKKWDPGCILPQVIEEGDREDLQRGDVNTLIHNSSPSPLILLLFCLLLSLPHPSPISKPTFFLFLLEKFVTNFGAQKNYLGSLLNAEFQVLPMVLIS